MSTPKIVVHTEKRWLYHPQRIFSIWNSWLPSLTSAYSRCWKLHVPAFLNLKVARDLQIYHTVEVCNDKSRYYSILLFVGCIEHTVSITNIWFIQFIHNSIHKSQTGLATGILHQLEQSNWHIDKSKWNHNQIAGLSFLDIFGLQPFSQNCSFEKGTSHRDPAKSSTLQVHP